MGKVLKIPLYGKIFAVVYFCSKIVSFYTSCFKYTNY